MTYKPLPYSHSSLKSFETCPQKHYHEKVIKVFPFTDTVHTIYGKELHKAAEEYVRDGVALPGKFLFIQGALDALKDIPGRKFCEHEMAVTAELKPCGFKDPQAWARGIADLLIVDDDALTAWVCDYKTGNDKYPDVDQLTLMSLLVFQNYPHIRQVKSSLLFVVKNTLIKHTVTLDDKEAYWQKYRERVASLVRAAETDRWDPKPNGLCRNWCPVESCLHNGRT